MRSRRTLVAGLALAVTLSPAATVTTERDPAADLTKYRTFALRVGTAATTPWGQQAIEESLSTMLQSKGLSAATEAPDLIVVTHVQRSVERRVAVDYGPGWQRWGMSPGIVTEYPVGTLIVDLVDAAKNEMVWRSVATDTLPSKPEKGRKWLEKVVTKMFKEFPGTTKAGTAN